MKLKQAGLWVLAALVLAAAAAYRHDHMVAAQAAAPATSAPATHAALPDFRGIVEQYGPAVVNISTEGVMKTDVPELFRGKPPAEVPVRGLGSGFIVSADGVVLTNAHVVSGASEVTVKLTDRREFSAKVLGTDPMTDVAVLRIDAKDLPTVRLGNPADLRPGDWVLAIGSPFGFENSVTAGVVSAKGRALPGEGSVPFLQTDVAVNPGNSGGPLFNLAGEVVGINSQILSASGGYQGLSFAVPIDVAARVEKQILAHGHARHAQLGVTIQGMDAALAQSFGLVKPEGALVSGVTAGSAAARAGLQPGDVILKANGEPIVESGDLPALVDRASPGDYLKLDVWRGGRTHALAATLGEAKQLSSAAAAKPDRLGLSVQPVPGGGLVVEGASGPALRAGIEPGDIVLALNGIPVKSADEFRTLVEKARGTVALLVQRDDARVYVPIHVG
jgi:serine protease Do